MKYLVIEIQTTSDGTVSNIVTAYDSLAAAESNYYAVLSAAAVSAVYSHGAVLITDDCRPVMNNVYKHYDGGYSNG